jgi:hypothetical protein
MHPERQYVAVIITIAVYPGYTVSCADTPEAVEADRVDPDCGWHVSQTSN